MIAAEKLLFAFGYGSIGLCLLTVALHDLVAWADRRGLRVWIVTMQYTTEVRQ